MSAGRCLVGDQHNDYQNHRKQRSEMDTKSEYVVVNVVVRLGYMIGVLFGSGQESGTAITA